MSAALVEVIADRVDSYAFCLDSREWMTACAADILGTHEMRSIRKALQTRYAAVAFRQLRDLPECHCFDFAAGLLPLQEGVIRRLAESDGLDPAAIEWIVSRPVDGDQ